MRYETARHRSGHLNSTAAAEDSTPRFISAGLLGIIALALMLSALMLLARPVAAESATDSLRVSANLEPTNFRADMPPASLAVPAESLDDLLAVRHPHRFRTDAEIADASIAAAVERGTNPDLVKASAFRKRNTDLFRTERPVEIGEQEMLLRIRLRAKSRETMSLELRF